MNAILTRLPAEVFDGPDPRAAIARVWHRHAEQEESSLLLGDLWFGLHFTLSGETPLPRTEAQKRGVAWLGDPLEDALMGGHDAGLEDDFGGARYHLPQEVPPIASALREMSEAEFREAFDPQALTENEIPPGRWWDDQDACDQLLEERERLIAFYTRCEAEVAGVLLRVSSL